MSSPQTTTAATAGIKRPLTFLSLVPVQSASYPKAPTKQSPELVPSSVPGVVEDIAPISPPLSPTDSELKPLPKTHRSSSVSSAGAQQRFLKLGPVFWGGVPGDNDFAIED